MADKPTWQEQLTAIADALFQTLKIHPKVVSLLDIHVPVGPRGLAGREAAIGILLANGFAPRTAARATDPAKRTPRR